MYTAREVATVLGLQPGRLAAYVRSGVVAPARGGRGELRFTFQDMALLRKAEGLVLCRVAPRKVGQALLRLRQRLGTQTPLTGVSLEAQGSQLVVSEGNRQWLPDSGQVLFDFSARPAVARDVSIAGAAITELSARRRSNSVAKREELSPEELFQQAVKVEESTPDEAMNLYRQVVLVVPGHADAQVNLGRLLHERGDVAAALVHYQAACAARPDDSTALFNVGVALEDLGRHEEACTIYEQALTVDSRNADAHYNLARLCEHLGRSDAAIRHLLLYRQLTRKPR